MTDSRIVPVKQLELRYGIMARDVRRLKQDALDATAAMSYKGNIFSAVNWDDYTTMGMYRVGLVAWGGTANGPILAYTYGTLVVHSGDLSTTQTYYPHNTATNGVWTRTKWNASDWVAWGVMPTLPAMPAPGTPSWTFRRNAAGQAANIDRAEFQKFGSRVFGSGRLAITDTSTGTGEMDVTFTGLGTPLYNTPCGTGNYYDSAGTGIGLYPVTVWVQTSARFVFIRQDTVTTGLVTLGQDPAPATDCNGDWLEWHFSFATS